MELVRVVIQKILSDKILLGLVVVAVLGFFVGGLTMSDDKPEGQKKSPEKQAAEPSKGKIAPCVEPALASDFIKWWIGQAMDYSVSTAEQNHKQAALWMTKETLPEFQAGFWSPEIANGVMSGRLVAVFQPTAVQAQAINPDGSVVVGVTGILNIQSNGQPSVQNYAGNFLVRRDQDGLRVAGLYTQKGGL